ncbi:MAG: hypothetical protein ABJ278_13725, partial [Marinomonas sp.]
DMNDITYCNVNRTLEHLCGYKARWFDPSDAWKIANHNSDAFLFQQDTTAFWNDPQRWDSIANPHLSSPSGKAFWDK